MGVLRLLLAICVVGGHAQSSVFGLNINGLDARYAVNFFFIISGFYMAMILNERYKDVGVFAFYKSRALRLYPTYYVGVLIAIITSGSEIYSFYGSLANSTKTYFVLSNLLIFGLDNNYWLCLKDVKGGCASDIGMLTIVPAWSLSVELGFYLLAPFVLRSFYRTALFGAVGILYLFAFSFIQFPLEPVGNGLIRAAVDSVTVNFFFYPSSFVFFAGGAISYHLRAIVKQGVGTQQYSLVLALLLLLSFSETVMPFWHMLLFALAIPLLFQVTKFISFDRHIGNLSYPVYITHYPILSFLKKISATDLGWFKMFSIGSLTTIVSCAVGWVIYRFLEMRVDAYRHSREVIGVKDYAKGLSGPGFCVVYGMAALYVIVPIPITVSLFGGAARHASTFALSITNEHWKNGFSRLSAAFTVPSNQYNREGLRLGRHIKFANGETRVIEKIQANERFMSVFVSGSLLDGLQVGAPNFFELIENGQVADTAASDVTNDSWKNGFSRTSPIFIVLDTKANRYRFRPGCHIRLSNGEVRRIEGVLSVDEFLQISLKGTALDGSLVGAPNTFTLLEHEENTAVSASDVTDENWQNGFSREAPVFLVSSTQKNVGGFRPGRQIRFANGDVRAIKGVKNRGVFLWVSLGGAPLDGTQVGFPRRFDILDEGP